MNSNPLVSPKHVITVDLERSFTKSLYKLLSLLLSTAKNHKWKTMLLLATLIGSWKTYGFYRTFRQMTGALTSDTKPAEYQKVSESKRELTLFVN
jgi:hypothetical protein